MLAKLIRDLNDLRRIRQARKVVFDTVSPRIAASRRRIGDIPPMVWHEPYLVGFVTTLASAIAIRATDGRLQGLVAS